MKRVGCIQDRGVPAQKKMVEELTVAAKILGLKLAMVSAETPSDLPRAFDDLRRNRVQALYVLDRAFSSVHRQAILSLSERSKIPVTFGARNRVEQGALLSYSADFGNMFRRAAYYVDRIFKGAKPSDLPVEQPTKFDLVVNMKTAKVLRLKIPQSIFIQASELIE